MLLGHPYGDGEQAVGMSPGEASEQGMCRGHQHMDSTEHQGASSSEKR